MIKLTENRVRRLQFKKTKRIDRLAIFVIREISNYFWIVVDILSHSNEKIAERYERSIGKEYKNECKEFNISKGKKILHVGCGSYPLTEMTIVRLFGVDVVGIDKNKKAVKRANEVILKKQLDKKIIIEQGNGADYPVKEFDIIIVSTCALPKTDILNHLFTNTKKNSIIVVRDLDTSTNEFLELINEYKYITIEKRIHHPVPSLMPIGWNAFYLKKK
jgi:2-polyprenyl-3-methyl-5-hydroxy-6-metoxy-1,4-benzoquinol methylase